MTDQTTAEAEGYAAFGSGAQGEGCTGEGKAKGEAMSEQSPQTTTMKQSHNGDDPESRYKDGYCDGLRIAYSESLRSDDLSAIRDRLALLAGQASDA